MASVTCHVTVVNCPGAPGNTQNVRGGAAALRYPENAVRRRVQIRVQLGLEPGAQFVVIADRDVVIFKLLEPPSLRDFAVLVGRARKAAKETELTRKDIAHAVRKVRRAR